MQGGKSTLAAERGQLASEVGGPRRRRTEVVSVVTSATAAATTAGRHLRKCYIFN